MECVYLGLGLSASGAVDGHSNHYEPVMMEPPGVHFDSSYSVLSTMDTQSSGMLQQNFDAHVCCLVIHLPLVSTLWRVKRIAKLAALKLTCVI